MHLPAGSAIFIKIHNRIGRGKLLVVVSNQPANSISIMYVLAYSTFKKMQKRLRKHRLLKPAGYVNFSYYRSSPVKVLRRPII
jgi:predicted ATP-dependent serine protease